ncbi:hypothetical protein MNBD_GAMMA03-10 [hydrothermal vent metagenome]|uniref:Glycosyl transferase family 1 domain-containing protein n=1 Tax=hydrothermal vent metagenome TaxID=652676 RepID=A0A3B0X083_9ZZZZ
MMKSVQFYTQIKTKNGFRGAQVKTRDYFDFINAHPNYKASICFHPNSLWSQDVLWSKENVGKLGKMLENPDIYLLKGGNDWLVFDKLNKRNKVIPVISPIVNYRILDSTHKSNALLKNRAIRVCPNPDLANRVKNNINTKGPVYCIPHGVNVSNVKLIDYQLRNIDLTIIAIKNPLLGMQVYHYFNKYFEIKIKLIDKYTSHDEFLKNLSNSKIALHLPKNKETYYLPGLESMGLGAITIMPNCLGNIYYSINKVNAFICKYQIRDVFKTVIDVLALDLYSMKKISKLGIEQSKSFSLEEEMKLWHKLLDNMEYFKDFCA